MTVLHRIDGPDVSAYQGNVNWDTVARHHRFGICKATEGLSYVDPMFQRNWARLRAVGLVRGCYHFARPQPGRSGQAEAVHFLDTVESRGGGFRKGDFRPILDIEWSSNLTMAVLQQWVSSFVHTVNAHVGEMPIIYTGAWWRDNHLDHHYGCPLWLAAYVKFPRFYVPRPWAHWSLWQYKDNAEVQGVPGLCDFNVCKSRRTFRRLRIGF